MKAAGAVNGHFVDVKSCSWMRRTVSRLSVIVRSGKTSKQHRARKGTTSQQSGSVSNESVAERLLHFRQSGACGSGVGGKRKGEAKPQEGKL